MSETVCETTSAEEVAQNVDFKKMIEEICKNMFPNIELTDEQLELFTKRFIADNGDEDDDNEEDDENDNDEEDSYNGEDDDSQDDNDEDSNDNDSNDNEDSDEEEYDFDDDEEEDDEDFDIRNLCLSCNYCGKVIDENSNYVITPCTHFLHTECIKERLSKKNVQTNETPSSEEELDKLLDKVADEMNLGEEHNHKEECDICMNLF